MKESGQRENLGREKAGRKKKGNINEKKRLRNEARLNEN
jgi:hypothetical protein